MRYRLIDEENTQGSALYRVLKNRGIEDPQHYLNTTDADIIPAETITNMVAAGRMLIPHIAAEHDIFINVDCDCDGYTSSAFMINWLYRTFPGYTTNHVSWGLHQDKAHGLMMDTILKQKPHLVICPDAGSNEYENHKILKENGIDSILDDRENLSIGAKIKDAKVLGTPYVLVLGDKMEGETLEVEDIKTGEKTQMNLEEVIKFL